MTRLFINILFFFLAGLIIGCSQVLQTVDLNLNSEDSSLQEEFNVVEKTLTSREAKAQKATPYLRLVLKNGRSENAQPIPENLALKSVFPKIEAPRDYIIVVGDTVAYSRLIENNRLNDQKYSHWPIESTAPTYKLGIGDTLALTLIKTTKPDQQFAPSGEIQNIIVTPQQVDETINSTGRIGSDGSVLLLKLAASRQMARA